MKQIPVSGQTFPLLQHVSVTSHPVTVHFQEQSGSIFCNPSHFVVEGSNKIFLWPSLLMAEQMLLPQPLLVCSLSFQIIGNGTILQPGFTVFALFAHLCQSFTTSKI